MEVGGIGYRVCIPLSVFQRYGGFDRSTTRIYVTQIVKEDSQLLYGFVSEADRDFFLKVIGVSGVGPTTGLLIMSSMSIEKIKGAVLSENQAAFQGIKGIGAKTAQQIILDLKPKFSKGDVGLFPSRIDPEVTGQVMGGLIALGFTKSASEKALATVLKDDLHFNDVAAIIKKCLNLLKG